MKIKKIKIPIYFGKLVIIFTDNLETIGKYNRSEIKNDLYDAFASEYKDEYVIAIKNVKWSVMSHEAVHIVNYIFRAVGINLDLNNDEAQAYLHGWIVNEIDKFLKQIEKEK